MRKEDLLNEMYGLVRRFDRDLIELMNLMRNKNELSEEIDIHSSNDIFTENKPNVLEKNFYETGDQINAEVIRIMTFGAICRLDVNNEGMIHISKMSDKRIDKVEDVLNIGDKVKVEVIKTGAKGIDLKLIKILN